MNRVIIGNINAVAIYITWAFLALMVLGLVGVMLSVESFALLILAGFAGLVVFGPVHVALSFFVRCPACNKMLTFQGPKKPMHAPKSSLDGWAHTAVKWFSGNVTCIHCGSSVNTKRL